MACLLSEFTQERIYLKNYHSFGRLAFSVCTLLTKPNISRLHAVIEWQEGAWLLKDLSSNGVWVNKQRIQTEKFVKLSLNDQICLAKDNQCMFRVIDLSPPKDLLLKLDPTSELVTDALPLAPYNLFPDEENPIAAIYYEPSQKSWFIERLSDAPCEPEPIIENSSFKLGFSVYKLHLIENLGRTELIPQAHYDLRDISFEFKLSQDEESTQMILTMPDRKINFDVRSHHYLTLNLARKRFLDMKSNVGEPEQGWIYADMLAKDIGVDANYLNIQIFRARKQFMDLFAGLVTPEDFIQRRAGKIRFGGTRFQIQKGTIIECHSQ